jgi:hypothetical protein
MLPPPPPRRRQPRRPPRQRHASHLTRLPPHCKKRGTAVKFYDPEALYTPCRSAMNYAPRRSLACLRLPSADSPQQSGGCAASQPPTALLYV